MQNAHKWGAMTTVSHVSPQNDCCFFFRRVKGSWLFWALAVLHVLWGVLLILLPMTDVLDYESALSTAVFQGFLMPPAFAALSRRTGSDTLLFWPQWVALGLSLTAIPLAFLLVFTLWNCPCGVFDGLLFWLMYPVCTVLFTATVFPALAQICRRRVCIAAAALVPWLFLAWSLARLYFDPPVFLHDPFFGFFSGAFYDRYIDIRPAFFAARAMHLAAAVAVAVLAAGHAGFLSRKFAKVAAGAGFLLALLLYFWGPELGMRFSHAQLRQAMGKSFDTGHFRIVHSPETDESRVRLMAVEAEWHREELLRFFGSAPQARITVYLFADEEQKRRFFGTRDVEVAKPWQNAVFITDNGFPHPSLRHELAHVFAAMWGDPVFGIAWTRLPVGPLRVRVPDPGAIEGIAVAAAGDSEDESLHAQARLLYEMGGFSPFETLFSPAFYGVSSARAYVQAGSFLRYVYETQGFGPLRRLYREGGPLAGILPGFAQVQEAYLAFLSTVHVPEYQLALARERFQRPPIHQQRCVHAVARTRRRAAACAGDGDASCALKALNEAHRMDPGNLETWMLHLGIVRRLLGASAAREAAVRVLSLAGEAAQLRVRAHMTLAEAAWLDGNTKAARKHLESLPAAVPPVVHREVVMLRTLLAISPEMPFLRPLFTQPVPAWLFLELLERSGAGRIPLLAYLQAGAALSLGRWQEAFRLLENLDVNALPDDFFRCEALHRRFLAAFLLRDFSAASMHLAQYETCPVQEHDAAYYRRFLDFASRSRLQWPLPAHPFWL